MRKLIPLLALSLSIATNLATADATTAALAHTKLQQAISDPSRPAEDTAQDKSRLPLETLQFFGLRDDMRVLDILPGSGYYVRLLAPALKDKGALYLTLGTESLESTLLKQAPFTHVKVASPGTSVHRPEGTRYYQLGKFDLQIDPVDMVTSFRAYHLFDDADRSRLNKEINKVLKPGGIYAVIDHTRRHSEPETEENRRRFDPVKAIVEIEEAGFDFVGYSPMHYSAQDDLTLEVGHETVTGKTDRWALKFVKRRDL